MNLISKIKEMLEDRSDRKKLLAHDANEALFAEMEPGTGYYLLCHKNGGGGEVCELHKYIKHVPIAAGTARLLNGSQIYMGGTK